jgi:hypothetical protein
MHSKYSGRRLLSTLRQLRSLRLRSAGSVDPRTMLNLSQGSGHADETKA